ncbi:putative lipid II flippase FtsW [Sesbania bispinosa]|nr:putative lipid II flippase FtsW [Sesbania bispinosa]
MEANRIIHRSRTEPRNSIKPAGESGCLDAVCAKGEAQGRVRDEKTKLARTVGGGKETHLAPEEPAAGAGTSKTSEPAGLPRIFGGFDGSE